MKKLQNYQNMLKTLEIWFFLKPLPPKKTDLKKTNIIFKKISKKDKTLKKIKNSQNITNPKQILKFERRKKCLPKKKL